MNSEVLSQTANRVPRPWVALAVLFSIGACSTADRYVLAMLVPDVKRELQLTDAEVGLLIGPAIAVLYAAIGVPLGHLADKIHRVRFLAACLCVWSASTGLGGWATSMWQLALSRVGVSAAEGGCAPTSMSLLADFFAPARRPLIGAIYASSSNLGILLAFAMGGFIAQHYGWRSALITAAFPGLVLAALLLSTVREPVRGGLDRQPVPSQKGSFWKTFRFLFTIPIYRRTLLAATFIHVGSAVITAWGPTFLYRKFGATSAAVGLNFGLGLSIIGATFVIASGWLIGRIGLSRFGLSLRIIGLLEACSVGFVLLALLAPNFQVAVLGLSFLFAFTNLYIPAQFVVMQNYLPANMRATGAATGSLIVILTVQSAVPPLVGVLSDALRPTWGNASLEAAMFVMLPAILLSAAQFFRAARTVDIIPAT